MNRVFVRTDPGPQEEGSSKPSVGLPMDFRNDLVMI